VPTQEDTAASSSGPGLTPSNSACATAISRSDSARPQEREPVRVGHRRGVGRAADGRGVLDHHPARIDAQDVGAAAAGHGDFGRLHRLAVAGDQEILLLRAVHPGHRHLQHHLEWLMGLHDQAGTDTAAGVRVHRNSMGARTSGRSVA
jgi:hypothetical protein